MLHTSSILELVHVDVWGPSPIVSVEGYQYYIRFLDDFTCFSWIFPMKVKSEAKGLFLQFQAFARGILIARLKVCKQIREASFVVCYLSLIKLVYAFAILVLMCMNKMVKLNKSIGILWINRFNSSCTSSYASKILVGNLFLCNLSNQQASYAYSSHESPFEAAYHRKLDYLQLKTFGVLVFLT